MVFINAVLFLAVKYDRCACSEFCGHELTESQFERAVYRLNHNILYLCFAQNVDPELLNAKHSVHNLLVMLDSPQLGRFDISLLPYGVCVSCSTMFPTEVLE